MMKKFIPPICILWLYLIPVPGFSQDGEWVMGDWKGGYYGEKSKLTKKFDSRLQILKVYGTVFEGVVQCILPGDTTVRLHTRISGRIYPNYLMTKLKEVVYFKDPPGQYTWAKHCFSCDSMKLNMVRKGDSIILQGERRCDTLCNIIARYSKSLANIAYKTPGARNGSQGPTRYDLVMELAPETANPFLATNTGKTTAAAKQTQQGNTATTSSGKPAVQPATTSGKSPGKPPGQPASAQANATAKSPGQAAIAPPISSGKPQPNSPTLSPGNTATQQIPAQGTPSGKSPMQSTSATSPGQPQPNGQTHSPGNTAIQQTSAPITSSGNLQGKQPATQATSTGNPPSQLVSQTVQQTSSNPNQAIPASSPTGSGEPLGYQTPGIDRDNVFTASMPLRSGGNSVTFARPMLRDSLTASEFIAGRTAVTSGRFVVNVDSAEVMLLDNGWVDGDTVSLYYNGQIIVHKIGLSTKAFIIKVPVYRGGANMLTVYAESVGSIPPNTAYVRLICGNRETSLLLSSTMSKSSSIELYRSGAGSD